MIESTSWLHFWILAATLPLLIASVIAIVATIRSPELAKQAKLLWSLVLLVPLLGLVLWTAAFWLPRRRPHS